MNILEQAKFYATRHHVFDNQQTWGILPYTHHLEYVENVLREFGVVDEEDLAAAWLHDIVEDTKVKIRDIEENFGSYIAMLVDAVTSVNTSDRASRVVLTYPKTRQGGMPAVRLKLADRIANTRKGGSMLSRYKKEYKDFRQNLFDVKHSEILPMWAELDRIMEFKYEC